MCVIYALILSLTLGKIKITAPVSVMNEFDEFIEQIKEHY